jgi:hypothetical protein
MHEQTSHAVDPYLTFWICFSQAQLGSIQRNIHKHQETAHDLCGMLEAALELQSLLRDKLDEYQESSSPAANSGGRDKQEESKCLILSPNLEIALAKCMGKPGHISADIGENGRQLGYSQTASRQGHKYGDSSSQQARNFESNDDIHASGTGQVDIGIQCLPRHMKIEEQKQRHATLYAAHGMCTDDSRSNHDSKHSSHRALSPATYKLWRYINSRMPDSDSD